MPSPPGVSIFISDVDRTGYLSPNKSFSWTNSANGRGNATIPFQVPPDDPYAPSSKEVVAIYENYRLTSTSKRVWLGYLNKPRITWEAGESDYHFLNYSAVSAEGWFDGILVPENKYEDIWSGELVQAIFNAISAQLPFPITLGTTVLGVFYSERSFDGKSSAAAAFSQAASDAGYIWYINPEDATLNYHPITYLAAPFEIQNGMILKGTLNWDEDASAQRDVQIVQLNPDVAPNEVAVFPGDGIETQFDLPKIADDVRGVCIVNGTAGVHADSSGTFSGQPSDGDTLTITPLYTPAITQPPYTFKNTLDNTVSFQVKIGADAEETCANLVAAINAGPGSGVKYSSPTWVNQQVSADPPTGSPALSFVIRAKVLGSTGNSIALTESCANFAWTDATLTGGTDFTGQLLRSGPLGAGAFDLNFEPGSDALQLQDPPRAGTSLVVTYRAAGSDKLVIGGGGSPTGTQFSVMRATAKTLEGAVAQGVAALAAFSQIPATVQFQIDIPGIQMGHKVVMNISTPGNSGALVNGNWFAKEVQGNLRPGWQKLPEPYGHFTYTITLVNNSAVSTYKDTLKKILTNEPLKPVTTNIPSTPPNTSGLGFLPRSHGFLCKDTTVGDDIADHFIVQTPITALGSPSLHQIMHALRILGENKKELTSDLTIRINKRTNVSPPDDVSWTFTLPAGHPVKLVKEQFISGSALFLDQDVIWWDVVASDGQKDKNGVATFIIEWQ